MTILIRKVNEPYGWLGNMSPHAIDWNNKQYRTSEALFQSLRFDDGKIIDQIRDQRSPMSAKMIAKKHRSKMIVEPMSDHDLANMKLCLSLKIEQHPELKNRLLQTGSQLIIEDCTKRKRGSGLFWGAAFDGKTWIGENWLGKLWMELRSQSSAGSGRPHFHFHN